MDLNNILAVALKANASDIHIKSGLPPIYRIDGALRPLPKAERLDAEGVHKMAYGIMNKHRQEHFEKHHEVDMAYGVAGLGRFRVNIFSQRGTISMVFRVIPFTCPALDDLHLPAVIKKIAMESRGLVLVTGAGKSTTLAAMIDFINTQRTEHVITVEDPIEFLHRDKKCIVNQREVGSDTASSMLCGRIRTSSWSAKCATWKQLKPLCMPPKPAIWFWLLCILSMRRNRSTASSRCFRPISTGRFAPSFRAFSKRSSPNAWYHVPMARVACRR